MALDFLMPFSGNPLDRASNFREDDAWVAERLAAPDTRFLLVSKLEVLTEGSGQARLLWLDSAVRAALREETPVVLLGVREGIAHFAVDVTDLPEPLTRLSTTGLLRDEAPRTIERWVEAACAGGLIRVSSDRYRTLSLTPRGRDVMAGRVEEVVDPDEAEGLRARELAAQSLAI